MSLPIVVTHPSSLFHRGLRHLFAKSHFQPVRITTSLTEELENYMRSHDSCVWLTGVEGCVSATSALVHKVVTANSGVKAVILAPSQNPEDIVAALRAGACGFLCQDIPGDQLIRSLELIGLAEMIVHPQLVLSPTAASLNQATDHLDNNPFVTKMGGIYSAHRFGAPSDLSPVTGEAASENPTGDAVPHLSRREMLILRMLMQGASNKVIACKLIITESDR